MKTSNDAAGLQLLLLPLPSSSDTYAPVRLATSVADWKALPRDALETILGHLPTADLLSARQACSAWRQAASCKVPVLDLSLKALACPTGIPQTVSMLHIAFPCIHTLVLTTVSFAAAGVHCPLPGWCACHPTNQHQADGVCSRSQTQACSLQGLPWIVSSILPLERTLQRLVLCDYPVFPLSPMRRLQLQQRWQRHHHQLARHRRAPGAAARPKQRQDQALDPDLFACWKGSAWLLMPLRTLRHLTSLELRLVTALPQASPPAQPPTGAHPSGSAAAAGADGVVPEVAGGASGGSVDQGEDVGHTRRERLLHLLAGQAALLGSLTSLSSLSLRILSVRMLAETQWQAKVGQGQAWAQGQPDGEGEEGEGAGGLAEEEEEEEEEGEEEEEDEEEGDLGDDAQGMLGEDDGRGNADSLPERGYSSHGAEHRQGSGASGMPGHLAADVGQGGDGSVTFEVEDDRHSAPECEIDFGDEGGAGADRGQHSDGAQAPADGESRLGEEALWQPSRAVISASYADQGQRPTGDAGPTGGGYAAQGQRPTGEAGPAGNGGAGSSGASSSSDGPGPATANRDHGRGQPTVSVPRGFWDVSVPAAVRQLRQLRSLSLAQCVVRRAELARLCAVLPGVRSLSLRGSVQLSHRGVKALAGLAALEDLELSQVRLVFRHLDADDCPETMMNHLYSSLGALSAFTSLRFELDIRDGTHYMHSAYLLGLYQDAFFDETPAASAHAQASVPAAPRRSSSAGASEHGWMSEEEAIGGALMAAPLALAPVPALGLREQLRSLELSQVVLDSDYTLMMIACLQSLCSLKLVYRTWPLSLAQNDLSLLAPLTALHTLHLTCADGEESDQTLLALTSHVLGALRTSFTQLSSLHYTGPIVLEDPTCPDLAAWTSLTDLSLTYVPSKEWSGGRASDDGWLDRQHAWPNRPGRDGQAAESRSSLSAGAGAGVPDGGGVGGGVGSGWWQQWQQWQQWLWGREEAPGATVARLPPQLRSLWEKDLALKRVRRQGSGSRGRTRGDDGLPDRTLLAMTLPVCLPTSLTSLSLSRVSVSACGLDRLGLRLPHLNQLSLEEFDLTWEHLLAVGTGPGTLHRQLRLLAISSTLPASTPEPQPAGRGGSSDWTSGMDPGARGMASECKGLRRVALRGLGRFQGLNYLLLGIPQQGRTSTAWEAAAAEAALPWTALEAAGMEPSLLDVASGSGGCGGHQGHADQEVTGGDLLLLRPALGRLKGLTLQAPKGSPGWSGEDVERLLGVRVPGVKECGRDGLVGCTSLRSLHVSCNVDLPQLRNSLPFLSR